MRDLIVKVCGMRDSDNIGEVEDIAVENHGFVKRVDWMGFIFSPRSPRYVTVRPERLPVGCGRVGVFVDESPETIMRRVEDYGLDAVQLHGSEQPCLCRRLRLSGVKVIKAIGVSTVLDMDKAEIYAPSCDYLLFDTKSSVAGGSGKGFDWSLLDCYRADTPFILSGGIGPESIGALRSLNHPQWCGIDINSRFETSPARKDARRIERFIYELNTND